MGNLTGVSVSESQAFDLEFRSHGGRQCSDRNEGGSNGSQTLPGHPVCVIYVLSGDPADVVIDGVGFVILFYVRGLFVHILDLNLDSMILLFDPFE